MYQPKNDDVLLTHESLNEAKRRIDNIQNRDATEDEAFLAWDMLDLIEQITSLEAGNAQLKESDRIKTEALKPFADRAYECEQIPENCNANIDIAVFHFRNAVKALKGEDDG